MRELARASLQGKGAEQQGREEKRWSPFWYVVGVCSGLILALWGVILFGGQPAPQRTTDFSNQPKILLFLVDGAIKRYAHYEGNRYPQKLSDLLPTYVSLGKEGLSHLDKLLYERDPGGGYRLSLHDRSAGEAVIILSPQGIVHMSPSVGGS